MTASLSVVLPYWLDRPPIEAIEIARAAAKAGYGSLWAGEMMTFDAFALASVIAREVPQLRLVVGPLAVGVRTPASLALGIASVSTLGARRADLALGASTPVVVSGWHGRPYKDALARMRETVAALRTILAGERSASVGAHASSQGFHLAGDAPHSSITIAAFAPGMLKLAAEIADRVVLNLVTPDQVARMRGMIDRAARAADRKPPPLTVWVPAACEPTEDAWRQLARQLVVYVGAPGYGEMFMKAGFADAVRLARSGVHPRVLLASIPRALMQAIGAIGSVEQVRERVAAYADAGADEVGIVPVTAGDEAGARTLAAVRGV